MSIEFSCPSCGVSTTVEDKYAGQTGPCRSCGESITIPGQPTSASTAEFHAPRKKSSAGVWAIVVLALCGLLIVPGILVALLLPAVQAARSAARRSNCMSNQKQIALALLNYESAYGHFPPAYITDGDGNPMHSWRVLILPFLGQQALYDSYNFDEPWDSPANSTVTAQCPYIYQCVEDPANVGSRDTNYLAIVGPNTILAPPPSDMPMEDQRNNAGTKMRDVTDGTSRTVMFTEQAATGIHWASPEDIPNGNTISIDSTAHRVGANLTFADGHIEFQVNNAPNQISLQSMATINDGQ